MALTDKLTAIGNAIREKTGGTEKLTLDAMPTEIAGIQTDPTIETLEVTSNGTYTASNGVDGYSPITVNVPQDGSPPESAFVISENCQYRFANGGWDWFIENYGDRITTNNISTATNMFYGTKLKSIPFNLNFKNDSYYEGTSMFYNANSLTSIGNIINAYFGNINDMFGFCYRLRYLPQFENCNFSRIQTYQYANCSSMFKSCFSLRNISEDFIKQIYTLRSSFHNYTIFYNGFNSCYSLDEIKGLNPQTKTMTSSMFNYSFSYCSRLKNATFALQNDNTPYTVSWKSQTIDLSTYTGYVSDNHKSYILKNNSGITADKEVTDDVTYQALKNDPDWFTTNVAYSRYNHDSAVATINSLPDTSAYLASAGGTNTIKFKGAAGSATDGGAINTLTEEEIAVATAKGWTVSLV